MPTHIALADPLTDEQRDVIHTSLGDFNALANADFWAARELPENAPRALHVVASDDAGRAIGGLIGETQFKWLRVSLMAVVPTHRKQGIGRQLMESAEREALARGCQFAFVDTMEYQAPAFYQKLGYAIAGKLDDWDSHGHAKFFLTKRLVCSDIKA